MLRILYAICICIFFLSCSKSNVENIKDAEGIKNKELYSVYINKYSDKELLTFLEGDFSGDNEDDLIIIYKESEYSNKLVGIYKDSNSGKILMTTPIPAPIENYTIKFYNIDEKVPNEILVSGKKGASIGFAVYRLENGELISLFENGMEKCC
ncbi:Cys-Cys-COOH (seleno)protein SaoC [Brachyspira pulli]|uniref:Cys-Cys-COOH (seleno)protein SaoC n=1 Tax=Brachyspira pulli TaxID=310721 RepID=UPI003004382A